MIDAACNRDFKATFPSEQCVYPTPGQVAEGDTVILHYHWLPSLRDLHI